VLFPGLSTARRPGCVRTRRSSIPIAFGGPATWYRPDIGARAGAG